MSTESPPASRANPAASAHAAADRPHPVPGNLLSVIEKTQSFGLKRYPISFWSYTHLTDHRQYMTEAAVDEWLDAGFTVPQSSNYDPGDSGQRAHVQQMLDWADARDMKLILCDPRCSARIAPGGGSISADYQEGVRAAVAEFGDHPATFGFYVGDEPDGTIKEAFFTCCRVQKAAAPHLHPFANLLPFLVRTKAMAGTDSWPDYLDEYVRKSSADLISYDYYAHMGPGQTGWHGYYRNLRLYREAAGRNGVPFWNTLLSVGHFRYRCPNQDEIRWQFNTTVASGAHGLLWFFYYMRQPQYNFRLAPVDEHWERTPTYDHIRRVQKNFHRHYGDLFTRLVSTRVTFHPEPFGEGELFCPNGVISRIMPDLEGHPILVGEFADADARRYAMVVNNSMTESVKVGVTFPGEDAQVFSWNWSGEEHSGGAYCSDGQHRDENGLTIDHWLAPGQEAVYRVESASAAGEPIHAA